MDLTFQPFKIASNICDIVPLRKLPTRYNACSFHSSDKHYPKYYILPTNIFLLPANNLMKNARTAPFTTYL